MSLIPYLGNTGGTNWDSLGDDYYRKLMMFPVSWHYASPSLQPGNFNLDGLFITTALYGGFIAMVKDPSKSLTLDDDDSGSSALYEFNQKINIFSSSGKLLSQFRIEAENIIAIQWTHNDQIACVLDDGQILLYNIYGHNVMTMDFGVDCRDNGITDVSTFRYGAIARSNNTNSIYYVSFSTSEAHKYPNIPITGSPMSIQLIPFNEFADDVDVDGVPSVLVSSVSGQLFLADSSNSVRDLDLNTGPISKMGTSICGTKICLFATSGFMYALDEEFRVIHDYNTESSVSPSHMFVANNLQLTQTFNDTTTCGDLNNIAGQGNDVVLVWNASTTSSPRSLVLVINNDNYIAYPYSSDVIPSNDIDGVRIINDTYCDIIQVLSSSLRACFDPSFKEKLTGPVNGLSNEVEPAALLLSAYIHYSNEEVEVESYITELTQSNTATIGISQLADALQFEVDPTTRKLLLKALAFAKLNIDIEQDNYPDAISELSRTFRVINQLCTTEYGFPLTPYCIDKMGIELLINRLIDTREHLLAFRIADYLNADTDHIIEAFCLKKIADASPHVSDQELCAIVVKMYNHSQTLSYTNIAICAQNNLRPSLAILLISYDKNYANRVSLLLSLDEFDLAMEAAVTSLDSDLVSIVLAQSEQGMTRIDFTHMVHKHPFAHACYQRMCEENMDLESLRLYHNNTQDVYETSIVLIRQAYECTHIVDRVAKLTAAKELITSSATKQYQHMAVFLDEQIELLKLEEKWSGELQDSLIDLPVRDLLERLICIRQDMKVTKLKQQQNMSQMHIDHVEVQSYAKIRDFDLLAKKATENRKGPIIGYEPFVDACLSMNNKTEASKYIQLLPDISDRLEWFCQLSMWGKAIDIAQKEKDVEALQVIRERCRDQSVHVQIDTILANMR